MNNDTPTAAHRAGVPCEGCTYQHRRGQRTLANIQPAEYACDNCGRALCRPHIQYEKRGDWWLCAQCLTAHERRAEQRGAA